MKNIIKKGIVNINGTNIRYTLNNNYFDSEVHPTSHCEFISLIDKKPNVITETGYRSHFLGISSNELTGLIESKHEWVVEKIARALVKDNGKQINNFSFGQKKELEHITAHQTTLF